MTSVRSSACPPRHYAGKDYFDRLYAPMVDAWALYDNAGAMPVLVDWSEKA